MSLHFSGHAGCYKTLADKCAAFSTQRKPKINRHKTLMRDYFKDKWLWYFPGCLLVDWSDGCDSLKRPGLSLSCGKQNGLETIGGERLGGEIDFSATISDPLNFTYPLHSRSASPHTPASLRDISCAQRGDKTHRLSVGPCIHLVPIAAPWTPYPRKWLFIGRRSLLFLLSGVSSRSKVKGNALTERGKTRDYSGKCKQTLPAASTETFNLQQQKVLHKR